MPRILSEVNRSPLWSIDWEKIILIGLFAVATFLAFYNLENNPRPWHDEGAALSVSKTLVEDGVYAVRNSDGYQTFGPVQSVGPTVILPVALIFKLFGVGLVQGRIVMAIYLLLTLIMFYVVGRTLFGPRVALLAVFLLLGSSAVRFLLIGRQVLGEVPAFGLFLTGWLAWAQAVRTKKRWFNLLAGLLIGLAMTTKSTYVLMGFGTLALLVIFDLIFYRQENTRWLIFTGLIAFACLATWTGWQVIYFGFDTFRGNAIKLSQLAKSTSGFDSHSSIQAFKFLFGAESGHFYYLWGFPALVYMGVLSLRRSQDSFILASLVIFTGLWLAYFLFWIIPWHHYALTPTAISALFVSKLWFDLTNGFNLSFRERWLEVHQGKPSRATSTLAALIAMVFMTFYPLQGIIRSDVFNQYSSPKQLASFLKKAVNNESTIETWERELSLLTDHNYHFPDQSILAQTHAFVFRGGTHNYALGADYFQKHKPDYVVVGWYARLADLYDTNFLTSHGELVITLGDYEIYKLK